MLPKRQWRKSTSNRVHPPIATGSGLRYDCIRMNRFLFVAVAALITSATLVFVTANGAVVGLIGWMAGYAAEAGLLAYRLKRLDKTPPQHSDPA